MTTFKEVLTKAPKALSDYAYIPELGDRKPVFEGVFSLLKDKKTSYTLRGSIFYSFCERIELLFEGVVLPASNKSIECGQIFTITSDNGWMGKVMTVQITIPNESVMVYGIVYYVSHGRTSNKIWRWNYLNGDIIYGESIVRGNVISRDRLTFTAGEYRIVLENSNGYKPQKRHRCLSHTCELTRLDGGVISKANAIQEIQLFSSFFSFVEGCKHAPFFIEGHDKTGNRYCWHGLGIDCSLISVSSWKPDFRDDDLIPLWVSFSAKYFESQDNADILNTLIHWYLEANMNSGLYEGAYLMAFTGIELLFEENRGDGRKNSDKVLFFLRKLHLDTKLKPEEISAIRNQLTHYKRSHRMAYASVPKNNKILRLELLLQILELSILLWLGYKGHYSDRMKPGYRGTNTHLVPWADKTMAT
jgi:hypothetical protein